MNRVAHILDFVSAKVTVNVHVVKMASTTGRAESYDQDIEQYESYTERVWLMTLSDDRKKAAVILSALGAKAYRLLKSMVAPHNHKSMRC